MRLVPRRKPQNMTNARVTLQAVPRDVDPETGKGKGLAGFVLTVIPEHGRDVLIPIEASVAFQLAQAIENAKRVIRDRPEIVKGSLTDLAELRRAQERGGAA